MLYNLPVDVVDLTRDEEEPQADVNNDSGLG